MTSTTRDDRIDEVASVPWAVIQREWRDREYDTLLQSISAFDRVTVDAIDDLLIGPKAPTRESARAVLERVFASAARHEDGSLLVALYVQGRCLEKWERTEDYERIRIVLGALDHAAAADGANDGLLPLVVSLAQVIDDAMGAEDAVSCSCPVALGTRSTRIVTRLKGLEEQLVRADGPRGARELIRSDAETTRRYFEKISAVAAAVLAFVEDDAPGPGPYLEHAVQTVTTDLEGDVYESELRAHRACLEALQQHASEPRLRVDAGELVYLYPFALKGRNLDRVAAADAGNIERAVAGLAAAGFTPATAHDLDLNDLWEGADGEARYSGASIELPSVSVDTTADETLTFKSEVRLSRLGNHHVRLWSRAGGKGIDGGLHTINQSLRRGSPAMGREGVKSGGGEGWNKLPVYAREVMDTLADALHGTAVTDSSAEFHAVLGAREVSVQYPGGATSPASADDVTALVGASLLFHPVRHLATALDEWIRYPKPSVRNLLAEEAYAGDLVVRTDNTTIHYMPSSPEWLIDEYEEMIEFVASLPPLFALWERQASELARKLDEHLAKEESLEELHEHEKRILELEQAIRGDLATLHSPTLCRTRGQREFLDALSEAARLPALESALEKDLRLLADRQARISAVVRQMRREQDDRRSGRIEIVLGFLAAASLVGVVQWLNDTFAFDSRGLHRTEALLLLAITLAIALYIITARRSS
jgi:hypothetical protein